MLDALNKIICHKHEETSHCSADAAHHVTVLPFSSSACDYADKVQAAQHSFRAVQNSRVSLNATPSALAARMCSSRYVCERATLHLSAHTGNTIPNILLPQESKNNFWDYQETAWNSQMT